MASLSYNKETEINQAFNSTSRYLDDLLNIDNPYFEGMVGRILFIHLNYSQIKLKLLIPKPHLPLTGFTFLNSFDLLECLVM